MSDSKDNQISISLGSGEERESRLAMLRKLAEHGNFYHKGKPSPSQWLQAFLDSLIELEQGISQTERKMTLAAQALLGLTSNGESEE